MNSLRFARAALRASPAAFKAPVQRRGYAEAVADKVGFLRNGQFFAALAGVWTAG
jgi:hypothetical protein